MRILIDRGAEYCGKPENHDFQLFLATEEIDHTRTKARHLQTNGICEQFRKITLQLISTKSAPGLSLAQRKRDLLVRSEVTACPKKCT